MKQTEKMTELVRCFQAGDTEALGEIYIESKDFLMSFGRKRIRGYEDDAEDIVQDAFQKALENLKDLHKAESALSWEASAFFCAAVFFAAVCFAAAIFSPMF